MSFASSTHLDDGVEAVILLRTFATVLKICSFEWSECVVFASMVDSQEQKPRSSYSVPLVHRVNASVVTVRTNTLVFVHVVISVRYYDKLL